MTKPIDHDEAGTPHLERRVIRVDASADPAGITASLRRAFAAGRVDDAEREFGDLLDRLN